MKPETRRRWLLLVALLVVGIGLAILLVPRRTGARLQERAAPPFATRATPELQRARDAAQVKSSEPSIELRVETGDGKPVAGASVELFRQDQTALPPGWSRELGQETDLNGKASLPAGAGSYLVAAHKDGVGAASKPVLKLSFVEQVSLLLVLRPAEELRGRLVSSRREGIPLGHVILTKLDSLAQSGSAPGGLARESVADENGRFRFAALEGGDYQLEARADGYSPVAKFVAAPSHGELEIVLTDAGHLQGVVEDEAGKGAADVEVSALGAEVVATQTSATGAYAMELAARDYQLIARAADGRVAVSRKPVAVRAGETAQAETLRLSAPSSLQGRVLASKARPVPGALLTATPIGGTRPSASSVSAAGGSYQLDRLPAGRYLVRVSAGGFNSIERQISLAAGQRATLDFNLSAGGAIAGTVRDSQGNPIANAIVTAGPHKIISYRVTFTNETSTGPDGRYLLDGVAPGITRVMALRPSATAGPVQLVDVPEEGLVTADFVLPGDGFVEGTVTLSGKRPLKEPAVVSVKLDDRQVGEIVCNPDGTYKATLTAGDYLLRAWVVGAAPADGGKPVRISAGMTTYQDLSISDDDNPDVIQLSVVDVGGAPAAGATVLVSIKMGAQQIGMLKTADENGLLKLAPWDQIPAPSVQFDAVLAGRSGTLALEKPALQGTLQLLPAASIHGVVNGVSTDAVLTVSLSPPLENGASIPVQIPPTTLIGSSFTLDGLPAVPVVVSATTPDGRSGRESVSLQPGEVTEVELDLTPAASIAGRVVDADKHGLPAYLILDSGATNSANADGTFHIDSVAAGQHTLTVGLGARYQQTTRAFAIEAGAALNLGDIVLELVKAERRVQ